jgi:hypothetical protein
LRSAHISLRSDSASIPSFNALDNCKVSE